VAIRNVSAPPRTPLGGAYDAPQTPSRLGRGIPTSFISASPFPTPGRFRDGATHWPGTNYEMLAPVTPTDPFRQSSIPRNFCGRQDVVTWIWMKKKWNQSCFSEKWAQKCRAINSTIRPTMKLIIHHAKRIGLHSVVLCTVSAFWKASVADVYSADNVSQQWIKNAINRYI